MIKIDIVKRVAQELGINDSEALTVIDVIIESMKDTICEHGRLEIRDFGVFQIKERKGRTGRNPRNLKEYPIPARRVVTFKLGKELKNFAASRSGPAVRLDARGKAPAAPKGDPPPENPADGN